MSVSVENLETVVTTVEALHDELGMVEPFDISSTIIERDGVKYLRYGQALLSAQDLRDIASVLEV